MRRALASSLPACATARAQRAGSTWPLTCSSRALARKRSSLDSAGACAALDGRAASCAGVSSAEFVCVSTMLNSEERIPGAYSLMRQRAASFVPARQVRDEQWCTEATHKLAVDSSADAGRRRGGFVKIRFALVVLLVSLCAALMPSAAAQVWPSAKPVRIIAVFPPGGSVDQVARALAQQLNIQTGQTFVVENRGGASGSIGTAALAKSEPDGYTIGVVFDTHAVNPSLIPNLPFDTLKDLTPLMLVGTGAMALVANAAQPYKSFKDVVAAARAKPGG